MATASIQKVYPGTPKRTVTDCTMDSSYLTGGEVFSAEDLGLNNVEIAVANIKTVSGTVDLAAAIPITQTGGGIKLKCMNAAHAEVTSTNSLASCVIRVTAWGV